LAFALLALTLTACAYFGSAAATLPDPGSKPRGRDQTSVVYDRNGRIIAKMFAEQDRTDVPLSKMPQELRQAVVATEDRRYYEHKGVDPLGIARAVVVDIATGSKAQGGSTITQQYVKNAFGGSEDTLRRKVQEAMFANKLEKRYSKDQILELYLNTIYFGHGAYGVESAAQTYFGKPASELDLAQSAMIAGVIKSPARYSPYLEPVAAVGRRNTVLKQMLDQKLISAAEYDAARASKVATAGLKRPSGSAPYFVEYVKEQLTERFGANAIYRGGLRIKTTLDLPMQRAAEKAIATALNRPTDPSASLVALEPATGQIRAMVGGRDFTRQQFNVAVQGRRPPGSAFKPFVLATALADGVSPEQTYPSGSASFKLPNGQTWRVSGASGNKGLVRLRAATEQSVNTVFAKLILDIGAEKVVKTAEKLGLHKGIAPVPAIALGGLADGVSPLEMAAAYGALGNSGKLATPYAITEVRDSSGRVLFSAKPSVREAIDAKVAYLTSDILKGVIANGTGHAATIGRPAAGKTGTTQQYRDAWFVGYTPQMATAVWVGYPEAQRAMTDVHGISVTGGSFPARIWANFMKASLKGVKPRNFVRPPGLVNKPVCRQTGDLATPYCPSTFAGVFLAESVPESCTVHATPTRIAVPDVGGMTKADALAALTKLMLRTRVVEKVVPGVANGVVASQQPAPGSVGTTRTVVTLTVSTGEASSMPPTALFSAPGEVAAGQAVAFDGSASTDDGRIVSYLWEFGDGGKASGKTVSHVYSQVGEYQVTLWVTDDRAQASSISHTLSVK
jgi:1A family penicillin-binding protein